MHGIPAIGNQVAAQYAHALKDLPHDGDADDQRVQNQASTQRTQAVKDQPHDNDADDQRVDNQASAQYYTQALQQQKHAGIGGNVDIVV